MTCTLTAGVLFAPAEARASCGDYVTMGSHHGPAADAPAQTPTEPPALPQPHEGRKPCSGPSCSPAPASMPVPPAPPAPPRASEWGSLLSADSLDSSGPAALFLEDATARPVRRACDIYHPPR